MKMEIDTLKTFVKTYVDAAQQAGTWKNTHENLFKLTDKIGKQITLSGSFQDKLEMLSGDDLPLGKSIEEFMADLPMVINPTKENQEGKYAENALKPYFPDVEECSYSYTLGKRIIPISIPYNNIERGCINAEVAANVLTDIKRKATDAGSLYRYAMKKQLLGNLAEKAIAVAHNDQLVKAITPITDTVSGEAFIKQVKNDVEETEFAGEKRSLSGTLIGATPSEDLVLFLKKGVMSTISVDVEAGAFNGTKVALPCKIVVVDDFGSGTNADRIAGMLVDTRGVKLHTGYIATRAQENGYSNFISLFEHSEYTGFLSKHTYVKVYTDK